MKSWLHGRLIQFVKIFSRSGLNDNLLRAIAQYKLQEAQSALNIGAGGELSRILKNHMSTLKEIDIDKKRNPDIVASVEDLSFLESNSIDVIFALEVLEHVQVTEKAIEEIYRILKHNGILVFSTPFILPIHDRPHDYYRFTKYGLSHLFKKFTPLHLVERNTYLESILVLLLRPLVNAPTLSKLGVSILFIFLIPLFPLFLILNKLIKCDEATTGYFGVLEKPSRLV